MEAAPAKTLLAVWNMALLMTALRPLTEQVERDPSVRASTDSLSDLPFHQLLDFPFLLLVRNLPGESSPGTDGHQARRARGESGNVGEAHSADALETLATVLYGLEQLSLCA